MIIPVYNSEKYLAETLESVLTQDIGLSQIEILAVNDGSTDQSLTLLELYANKYKQIRLFTIPNSGSAAAPCNLGLDNAKGEFVFILGSDDLIVKSFLRTAVRVARDTGDPIVLPRMEVFGPEGRTVPTAMFTKNHRNADFIDSKAYLAVSAIKLFNRDLIEQNQIRFPLGYAVGEDQPFALKTYLHASGISTLSDRPYYFVRNREDQSNLTATLQPASAELRKVYDCVSVITELSVPGKRQDTLLQRYLFGANALRGGFGERFIADLDAKQRAEAVASFQSLLGPLFSHDLKSLANAETQVIFELIVRGKLEALESVSKELADQGYLTFDVDETKRTFCYTNENCQVEVKEKGAPLSDLINVVLDRDSLLLELSITAAHITRIPDNFGFLWRHRKTKVETPLELTYTVNRSTWVKTKLSTFSAIGRWDAYVIYSWGAFTVEQRLKVRSLQFRKIFPIALSRSKEDAAYLTEFNNLTVHLSEKVDAGGLLPRLYKRFLMALRAN